MKKLIGGIAAVLVLAGAAALVWSGTSRTSPSSSPSSHGSPSAGSTASGPTASGSPSGNVTFAPYVAVSAGSVHDMAATADQAGVKDFTLGFVVSGDGCAPVWDGAEGLTVTGLATRISQLRAAGGTFAVSFGGQDGTELALACDSVSDLAYVYAQVIDRYDLTEVDFDIEGSALRDTAANTLRAKAIAQLQKEGTGEDRVPRISFTLPAMPQGLTDDAVALLENAEHNGVDIGTVNIMAMDYGSSYTGDMGDYAVRAATAAHTQLRSVLGLSSAAAWRTLAVTPMIGVNDITTEVFTVSDARQLAAFAARERLGRLSMWSASRDTSSLAFSRALSGAAASG